MYHFTILAISDRARLNIDNNKRSLSEFAQEVADIKFVDAKKQDLAKIFKNNDIEIAANMQRPVKRGALGCFASYVEVFKYIVQNNIDHLLVLEDDAIIKDSELLNKIVLSTIENVPGYDFLSFYSTRVLTKEKHRNQGIWQMRVGNRNIDIGDDYIERSYPQQHSTVCTMFSNVGAKKILSWLDASGQGAYTPIDDLIFNLSRHEILEGYRIKPAFSGIVVHDDSLLSERKKFERVR